MCSAAYVDRAASVKVCMRPNNTVKGHEILTYFRLLLANLDEDFKYH